MLEEVLEEEGKQQKQLLQVHGEYHSNFQGLLGTMFQKHN
jgi:hypothetical protein